MSHSSLYTSTNTRANTSSKSHWKKGDYEMFQQAFEILRINSKGTKIVKPVSLDLHKDEYERLKAMKAGFKGKSLDELTMIIKGFTSADIEYKLLSRLKSAIMQKETPFLTLPENTMGLMIKEMLRRVEPSDATVETPSVMGERILSIQELQSVSREANAQIKPHLMHWVNQLKPTVMFGSVPLDCYLVDVMKDGSWMALQNLKPEVYTTFSFIDLKEPFERAVFHHFDTFVDTRELVYERGFYGKHFVVLFESRLIWYSMDLKKIVRQVIFEQNGEIGAFAISPDGNTCVVYFIEEPQMFYIYQKESDETLINELNFEGDEVIRKILFSPDGQTLIIYVSVIEDEDDIENENILYSFHRLYFIKNLINENISMVFIENQLHFIKNHDFGIKNLYFTPDSKHLFYSMKINFEDEYVYVAKETDNGDWKSNKIFTNIHLSHSYYKVLLHSFIEHLSYHDGRLCMIIRTEQKDSKIVWVNDVFTKEPKLVVLDIETYQKNTRIQLGFYKDFMLLRLGNQLRIYVSKASRYISKPYIVLNNVRGVFQPTDALEDVYWMNKTAINRFSMKALDAFMFDH